MKYGQNSAARRVTYRVGQGITYLRPRRAEIIDQRLHERLTSAEFALLSRLPLADRAHHLTVYESLVRYGCHDRDLLKAALLHDVGKADGTLRVNLVHRSVAVILRQFVPRLFKRLASPDAMRWRHALFLVEAHPEIGADLARRAGCGDRVCWIIAHHHDEASYDEGLELLRRADDGRLT